MFESVLIANRGEIAIRIARTLKRLGITAYGVYAPVDAGAAHTRAVDRALPLEAAPGAAALAPYLDIAAIVAAARSCGARAVHPGYGFLAESAEAARACERAGLVWIGPDAEAIARLGDKGEAKGLALAAGVPVVPGLSEEGPGVEIDAERVAAFGAEAGYPLLVKAAGGGGGKGMRRIDSEGEIAAALDVARREALAAFGVDRLLVERLVQPARHIEVQFAVDRTGEAVAFCERECSLQRRHQKLVEESPSPAVSPALRHRLGRAAVELARAAGYTNLGTAEFLVEFDDPERFYFLEINARLQVEHPVTEAVTGLDLVELQLALAAGEPLDEEVRRAAERLDGHAIEARICAERPADGFLPATGMIELYEEPDSVRVDSGVERGSAVTADFDPMLAKLIARAPGREEAVATLREALRHLVTLGVETNADFLAWLLDRAEVRDGATTVGLVERLVDSGEYRRARAEALPRALAAAENVCVRAAREGARAGLAGEPIGGSRIEGEGFDRADGWRLHGTGRGHWDLRDEDGVEHRLAAAPAAGGSPYAWLLDHDRVRVQGDFGVFEFEFVRERSAEDSGPGGLEATLPGVVLAVAVEPGDRVRAGQTLLTVESMKMEIEVTAPEDGTVAAVNVVPGDHVTRGQSLVEMEGEQ